MKLLMCLEDSNGELCMIGNEVNITKKGLTKKEGKLRRIKDDYLTLDHSDGELIIYISDIKHIEKIKYISMCDVGDDLCVDKASNGRCLQDGYCGFKKNVRR